MTVLSKQYHRTICTEYTNLEISNSATIGNASDVIRILL